MSVQRGDYCADAPVAVDEDLDFFYTQMMDSVVRTPVRRTHLRAAVHAALGSSSQLPTPRAAAGTIPSPRAAAASAATAPAAAVTTPAVPPLGRRVLYVDDNPMLTRLVERILAADPTVTVQTAPDGATGLSLAIAQQPDIVLLDLHLSDMSGEALLLRLRSDARTRSIPAVIVSGDTAPSTVERLGKLGAAAYLTKPFTASQLRELLGGELLGQEPLGQEPLGGGPARP